MSSLLFEHLEQFSGNKFSKLYKQPSAALAIFRRMLPHLAKSIVMAMLFMKDPLSYADLNLWVRPSSRREREEATVILQSLHMIDEKKFGPQGERQRGIQLSSSFATSLRHALTGGGSHQSFGVPCSTTDLSPVSVALLDDFARSKWEAVLGYMVGSSGAALGQTLVAVSPAVKAILERGGLVDISTNRPRITKDGFAFVLQETNAQVWKVLLQYAQTMEEEEELNMDHVEVLSFIFLLSSLELGQGYSTETLTPTQARVLEDLIDFGIIYQQAEDRFYPTRLATTLTSDSGALPNSITGTEGSNTTTSAEKGYIIIETNFRLYAYTSSPLQIAVLGLFTKLISKYPNLVSGRITRKSVRSAVGLGIDADQIILYLAAHAHPQMRKRHAARTPAPTAQTSSSSFSSHKSVIPPTVLDQIRLWQIEGERMKTTEGFLFRDFDSKAEYEEPCRYAETLGVLVWKNDKKRMFFVFKHKEVAEFIGSRKSRAARDEDGGGGGGG